MSAKSFGLDIGRSFIKAVQVEAKNNKKVLMAAVSKQTPSGGIQSESPVDLGKVSDAIKACVDEAKISTDKCVVSLIESQVVARLIQLPTLTDKELAAAINWEAEQYIPLPIKDVFLQYKVVSRPQESSTSGKMDVLLIASPKRVIQKYLNVVRNANLRPEILETELIVAYGGNVLFTRSIATGGVTLTRAVMAEFNLPQAQAEEYKQTYGILEDKLSGKVAAVLKPILDILISEILKAVEFAHSHVENSQISRIVICGGGAYLPGLPEFLAERTSFEVSLGDAWTDFVKEGLILKLPGQGSFYCVATGLALRR